MSQQWYRHMPLTQSRSPASLSASSDSFSVGISFSCPGFSRINLRERHERNSREGWFAVLARPDAYSIDSPGLCRRLRDGMVDDFARERLSEEMGDCGVPGKSGDVDSGSATLLLPLGASACWQMVYIFSLPAAIGVAGLAFFSPPEKQPQTSTKAHQNSIRARMALAGIFGLTSLGALGLRFTQFISITLPCPPYADRSRVLLALGFVFGAAWWTISREKPRRTLGELLQASYML